MQPAPGTAATRNKREGTRRSARFPCGRRSQQRVGVRTPGCVDNCPLPAADVCVYHRDHPAALEGQQLQGSNQRVRAPSGCAILAGHGRCDRPLLVFATYAHFMPPAAAAARPFTAGSW